MHMSELLDEIREKAESRAKVLQKDIQEARDLIAMYEAELAPLLVILRATSPKDTRPTTGTVEAVAAAVEAAGEGLGRPVVYSRTTELPKHPHTGEVLNMSSSEAMLKTADKVAKEVKVVKAAKSASAQVSTPRRWSQYKLPPRVRLFLAKFGNAKGQIRREQVMEWYRTVNPDIDLSSLKQAASDITGILVTKGVLNRDAPGVYSFAPKTQS